MKQKGFLSAKGLLLVYLLVTVALLPWFSLLLSLPAMLTVKAEVRCPKTVRLHMPARSSLVVTCPFPLPQLVCRIRLHNSLTGSRFIGTPGELIPSAHCGCMCSAMPCRICVR